MKINTGKQKEHKQKKNMKRKKIQVRKRLHYII